MFIRVIRGEISVSARNFFDKKTPALRAGVCKYKKRKQRERYFLLFFFAFFLAGFFVAMTKYRISLAQ
ncbi:MAG TPA: hypothetical protein VK785_02095 [Opitutaceae bacterium]|nr:hypothetical protein [Opitutaceae bacterium]